MQGDAKQTRVNLYVVPGCPLCGALRAMHRLTRQRLVPVFEYEGRALVRPADEELAEFLL
jgi:hypothetical protein